MSVEQSTVEYRDIPGFPGYRAGSDGTIWSSRIRCSGRIGTKWKLRKLTPGRGGYLMVHLAQGKGIKIINKYVHRLILEAFVGPCPDGMEGCHRPDPTRTNNSIANLCWDTAKSNVADMKAQGRGKNGYTNSPRKLTDEEVVAIRTDYVRGVTKQIDLAAKYGIHQTGISKIILRYSGAHIRLPSSCLRGDG